MENALMERHKLTEEDAQRIALIANGNYNEALQLVQQAENKLDQLWREWLAACLNHALRPSGTTVDALYKANAQIEKLTRDEVKALIQYGLMFFNALISMTAGLPGRLQENERHFAQKVLNHLSFDDIYVLTEVVNAMHYQVERNGSMRIIVSSAALKIAAQVKQKTAV
jgi:DNA polymerase-3 subunit delta'